MADCCLIKKVATVEVYENKNEVRAYGFMAGDRNTPVMEVRFKHLWGEDNLSACKLRWIIVDDVGSLLVGEVPIQEDNTATIKLPNELFTGERRMKVQLTVASCDGSRILNLQQFTDLKVINNLATNEVVEPVYNILINKLHDDADKYISEMNDLAYDLVKYISEQGFRIRINQANHGFTFNPIQYDTGLAKYVKATKENPADAMAIKVDNDNFDLVTSGSYPLSSGIKDVFGKDIVEDEYYFLDENVAGGFTPIKPVHIYQPLFLVAKDKGKLRALIEVETPTDLQPRIMNDFFDEQVDRVVNTADEKIEEIKTTQGMKGDKGDKGDTGAVGPQGIQGMQGLKGEKGDTGSQGLKGDKGDQGIQGPQGIKGDTGIQGPIGPQGDKGDKGDAGSLVNIANNEEISLWLGTTADYEAIVEKSKGVLYQHFDADGNFAGGYYKKKIEIPKNGLSHWLDAIDGVVGEDFLIDRIDNDLQIPIYGLNHDVDSGFTGKSLKFDGVKDWLWLNKTFSGDKTFIITFSQTKILSNEFNYMWSMHHVLTNKLPHLNYDRRSGVGVNDYFNWSDRSKKISDLSYIMAVLVLNTETDKTKFSSYFYNKDGLIAEFVDYLESSILDFNYQFLTARQNTVENRFACLEFYSALTYNRALTKKEIEQIHEYEKSIDRTTPSTYPLLQEQKSYGIGLTNQLSEEQKSTFRLSVDGTKFVAGLGYCEGLDVEEFTYSEIQKEMEKEEWTNREEEVEYV